ncbi:MAG: D-alanyl-D-alanine carboxypeptidase, partial [Mangrovicoccus sp.]|nr:D-alanyl-D-alanine carboxypeptidase [Mangrovicoccus sp.]
MTRLRRNALIWAGILVVAVGFGAALSRPASAVPYAEIVIDARSGQVIREQNADSRLHPASLTKMMTLYVAFDAINRGEIGLDDYVTVSAHAAGEAPSKLYLKPGQKIQVRYLIRGAAIKSANDAAMAIAEAISGSQQSFAQRMTLTAKALGMSRSTFKNPNGLTQDGHLSTARDMTTLGRALFYHFPEYYSLFSRQSVEIGGKTVYNTNRKLLDSYEGADGIKTGYTVAAGFNLTASAERGRERIIATVFGGTSSTSRNARVAELLDLGFKKAPRRVAVKAPSRPNLTAIASAYTIHGSQTKGVAVAAANPAPAEAAAASTAATVANSNRPAERPAGEQGVAALASTVPTTRVSSDAVEAALAAAIQSDSALASPASPPPSRRPGITFSTQDASAPATATSKNGAVTVARASTSDSDRSWGISVGTYTSQYEAERALLKTALSEVETLDSALRKVVRGKKGFSATFVGM